MITNSSNKSSRPSGLIGRALEARGRADAPRPGQPGDLWLVPALPVQMGCVRAKERGLLSTRLGSPGFLATSALLLALCPGQQSLSQMQESISLADNNLF